MVHPVRDEARRGESGSVRVERARTRPYLTPYGGHLPTHAWLTRLNRSVSSSFIIVIRLQHRAMVEQAVHGASATDTFRSQHSGSRRAPRDLRRAAMEQDA